MLALIEYSKNNELSDDEILSLAIKLAKSGSELKINGPVYDIPSTGGPSSLTTLICPLILKLLGKPVLKLGVPGRPAGGIDVLAQLNGYNYSPDLFQIKKWIRKCNYVHFIAASEFAPLDAKLFSLRKQAFGINVPALAIASLLSKKIALGLTHVGLDVRVWQEGNFGGNMEIARDNSKRFIRISKNVGINAKCYLTDLSIPQQPFIGRGESLLALYNIFNLSGSELLNKHLADCTIMALNLCSEDKYSFTINDIADAFFENLKVQGSKKQVFINYAMKIKAEHIYEIRSKHSGFLNINLGEVRKAIVRVQSKGLGNFPDTCGIILNRNAGDLIFTDDLICTFRCVESEINLFRTELQNSLQVVSTPLINQKIEVVS